MCKARGFGCIALQPTLGVGSAAVPQVYETNEDEVILETPILWGSNAKIRIAAKVAVPLASAPPPRPPYSSDLNSPIPRPEIQTGVRRCGSCR